MAKLYNLARMTTATTGTGTITLGSAVSGYLTFSAAGVANGDVIDYAIKDGSSSEHGTGTYTSSGTTLTRTVTKSTNSNAAISLSGTAEVFISPRAETLNDASIITTGTMATARLGSGTANSTAFLAGDQTYKQYAAIATSASASDLSTGTVPLARRGYKMPDVIIEEQQASGTSGGTSTAGAWFTRVLNTLVRNAGSIASLASNQVTLGAGTYYFEWVAPCGISDQNQTRLFNVSDGTVAGYGSNAYSSNNTSAGVSVTQSQGGAVVTIAASKIFRVEHRVTTSSANPGALGVAHSFGNVNVYSRLEITQLA